MSCTNQQKAIQNHDPTVTLLSDFLLSKLSATVRSPTVPRRPPPYAAVCRRPLPRAWLHHLDACEYLVPGREHLDVGRDGRGPWNAWNPLQPRNRVQPAYWGNGHLHLHFWSRARRQRSRRLRCSSAILDHTKTFKVSIQTSQNHGSSRWASASWGQAPGSSSYRQVKLVSSLSSMYLASASSRLAPTSMRPAGKQGSGKHAKVPGKLQALAQRRFCHVCLQLQPPTLVTGALAPTPASTVPTVNKCKRTNQFQVSWNV
jgi:hypothetical protein